MNIPVRATIEDIIAHKPAYLEFGTVAAAKTQERTIVLSSSEDFLLSGSQVELIVNGKKQRDPLDMVTVSALKRRANGERYVSVVLNNTASLQGSAHGKIVLKTETAPQRELAVDFYALFR